MRHSLILVVALLAGLSGCAAMNKQVNQRCVQGALTDDCAPGLSCQEPERCSGKPGCLGWCIQGCSADADCPTGCTCSSAMSRQAGGRVCTGARCGSHVE